jgi:hypothetical protein
MALASVDVSSLLAQGMAVDCSRSWLTDREVLQGTVRAVIFDAKELVRLCDEQ